MTKIQINRGNGNIQEADDDTTHQVQISLGWEAWAVIITIFVVFWSILIYSVW